MFHRRFNRQVPERLLYIRGIVRGNLADKNQPCNDDWALELLSNALNAGVSIPDLETLAQSDSIQDFDDFRTLIAEAIERRR